LRRGRETGTSKAAKKTATTSPAASPTPSDLKKYLEMTGWKGAPGTPPLRITWMVSGFRVKVFFI
jgi:hypothetical protein